MIEATSEQTAAIESRAEKLVVSAAAGSGKTRVLSERYFKHVATDGFRPDQILTITFTRKAAAEMKKRIVGRLRDAGLLDEAQQAETGPIQTIHAFCQRLLMENAVAAGLDPRFEVMSGDKPTRLLSAALRQTLADPPENELVSELLCKAAGRRSYENPRSTSAALEAIVSSFFDGARAAGMTAGDLESAYSDPAEIQATWEKTVLACAPEAVRVHWPESNGQTFAERLIDAFKKAGLKRHGVELVAEGDLQAAEDTAAAAILTANVWRFVERKMLDLQELDFTLMERLAIELVDSNELVRQRLQRQYRVALVDEAQDMNRLQHRLIDSLQIESEMMVGDRKQSIFGFRQADLEVFVGKQSRAESVQLNQNFRSDPGILMFVDKVFSEKWKDAYEGMFQPPPNLDIPLEPSYPGVEFWDLDQFDSVAVAEWIKETIREGVDPSDIAVLTRANAQGAKIQGALEALGVASRHLGGSERYFARMEIRDVSNALIALCRPTDDYALLACLRSPFGELSLDACVRLAQGGKIRAKLDAFESSVTGDGKKLETFNNWFQSLSAIADRLPAWEVLSILLAQSPYLANIGRSPNAEAKLANVRKLLRLAAAEPETNALAFSERIREIQEIRHKEGDAPTTDDGEKAVTIISIHKAKGLEWPVVVVPDVYKKITKGFRRDIETDPRLPMFVVNLEGNSFFQNWMRTRRSARDEEEDWRVLYVALTRARNRLCVGVKRRGDTSTFAGQIARFLGYSDSESIPAGIKVRSMGG